MRSGLAGWRRSWRELGQPAADEVLYHRLVACWREPHRHYHTLQHLYECLDLFEGVRSTAQRPGEIELALWFHDAFYDPTRDDNEERSAEWARASVLEAGLPRDVADRLHALVMATRHEAVPQDADAQLLVDVDLAILGSAPARFDESDEQIRLEYAHVPEDEFRAGRRRVLGDFLARPRLYSTESFHSRFERQARENLGRALARLGG
jgi:predicted metal-dependent HD superfamily phosphohydrolase